MESPTTNPDGNMQHVPAHDVYVTGTGQRLSNTHPEHACEGEHCVIHNPSNHSMRNFPTHWRVDRQLMERICPHGVGHPDPDDIAFKSRHYGQEIAGIESIHGCDGCCHAGGGIQL